MARRRGLDFAASLAKLQRHRAARLPLRERRVIFKADDGTRRRLFKISAAPSFGGFIVSFDRSDALARWTYGPARFPQGDSSTGALDEEHVTPFDTPPKFHYHPDGWLTLNQMGNMPRRDIRALPYEQVAGRHVMTMLLERPDKFPVVSGERASDIELSGTGELRVLKVVGYIHPMRDLDSIGSKPGEAGMNPFVIPAKNSSNDRLQVIARMDGYGHDAYVRLDFHTNPEEFKGNTGYPAALLLAFNPEQMGDADLEATSLAMFGGPVSS